MAVTEEMLQEVEEITRILRAWDVWDAEKLPMPPRRPDDEKIADTIDALLAEIAALRRALDDLASKVMNHKDAIRFDFSRDCDSARHEMWNAAESVLAKLPTPPAGGAHG
jgi:hypothetical protein